MFQKFSQITTRQLSLLSMLMFTGSLVLGAKSGKQIVIDRTPIKLSNLERPLKANTFLKVNTNALAAWGFTPQNEAVNTDGINTSEPKLEDNAEKINIVAVVNSNKSRKIVFIEHSGTYTQLAIGDEFQGSKLVDVSLSSVIFENNEGSRMSFSVFTNSTEHMASKENLESRKINDQ